MPAVGDAALCQDLIGGWSPPSGEGDRQAGGSTGQGQAVPCDTQ